MAGLEGASPITLGAVDCARWSQALKAKGKRSDADL